jgi:hypothetical protein
MSSCTFRVTDGSKFAMSEESDHEEKNGPPPSNRKPPFRPGPGRSNGLGGEMAYADA